ncbi:hypothetical protein BJV74DRAFT_888838 [Russula compacta]|nr:hypothetical protein BJV74DRAFT_888838 [Russula compacta]
MFSLLFFLLAHIVTLDLVLATSISVPIPLDSQLPPFVRIDHPYSWAFAEGTFLSARNASLVYSTSSLPAWLSFNPTNRTFSGMPALDDEGTLRIQVMATDPETSDSASSSFRLDNPSLSSVFLLSGDNSALQRTENPTLRIPPSWSFSIGFDGNTFTSPDGIRYALLQADGSPLPSWMQFNPYEVTLNGVTPPLPELLTPYLSLALHASDRDGFSAASELFDLSIAAHELHSSSGGLPTINITSSTTLDVFLNSQTDFDGVLVDSAPLDLQDLVSVEIDVSQYNWLHYDAKSCRLTGQPPSNLNATVLPVVLTTNYNQTLHTQVKLASVPSYFSQETLPTIFAAPGKEVYFNFTPFILNPTQDVDLTASYEPAAASSYLHFDMASAVLSGSIPSSGKVNYTLITVSFTAYSRLTHSTSHSSLPISLTPTDYGHTHPATGSSFRVSHRKLALGLGIALGLFGGFLVLGLLLATLRCLVRPADSALTGVAATRAMTESERQWYGIGDATEAEDRSDSAEKGYGTRPDRQRGELGIGFSRAGTVTSSDDERTLASPGQLSKGEFLSRLRATVRKISGRYRSTRKSAIGRPILVLEEGDPRLPGAPVTRVIPALAGYEPMSYTGTTSSLRGSPSSSIGERSIPQRRADFAPPRVPAPVAVPAPTRSLDSDISLASDSSTRLHAAEAVVQRATRARSVRSASGLSRADNDVAYARVVPFTASRTPVPRDGTAGAGAGVSAPARASSLSASVVRMVVPSQLGGGGATVTTTEADELHVGLRYVRALGEDAREASDSFSSLESSHPTLSRSDMNTGSGGGVGGRGEVLRVLVRVGERFRFRMPVRAGASAGGGLTARRVSGELLPAFLYADLGVARGDKHRDTVKFWGVPRADDVGDVHVGVYAANGVCVAEAVIEVLTRSG